MAGGGAEKVLLTILNKLCPPDYQIDLLLIKNKGIHLKAIPSYVNVITMTDTKQNESFPTDCSILENYCQKNISQNYDVEIAFLEGPPTKLIAHHKNTTAKKIAWVHTDLEKMHWTYSYYRSDEEERKIYEMFDQIIFVSKGAMQGFLNRFNKIKTPCTVIANPIDCKTIKKLSTEYIIPNHQFTVCSVGSLSTIKGHSRLFYAMGRLFDDGFRFHLNLVGEGNNRDTLNELSHILNIESYVHFIGFKSNPYPYIINADLVISSSISEGYPLALCEALCLNRPVIATNCSGNRDVLNNGQFGFLIDNSEEGIYGGLRSILEDKSVLSELCRLSRCGSDRLLCDEIITRICSLF